MIHGTSNLSSVFATLQEIESLEVQEDCLLDFQLCDLYTEILYHSCLLKPGIIYYIHCTAASPFQKDKNSLIIVSYLILRTNTTLNQPAPGKNRLRWIMLQSS